MKAKDRPRPAEPVFFACQRSFCGQQVAPGRLSSLGLGGTQPVADNNVPAERPRNRRVVLRPLP